PSPASLSAAKPAMPLQGRTRGRAEGGASMIVVARRTDETGEVRILRSRADGSHAYVRGDWYQSHADRSGVSLAAYVHALHGLVLQAGAVRVLVVGCAGGTLGTML